MTDPRIVAFLSAGRCGTQWLTAGLRELHPDITSEHEPIGPFYKPRQYFRRYEDPDALLAVPQVVRHVARIEREQRTYVETGWPLFAALPLFARCFPDRLRIVHLTRHPVPSALSHLAHGSYAGSPRNDAYTRWATLGPTDPRVFQASYVSRWERLTPYEKCLFWWTEVQLFGLELPMRLVDVPFIRVRAEELLDGSQTALRRLLDFIGLPWRREWLERARQVVDRWHQPIAHTLEPLTVLEHPAAVAAASRLGYDISRVDVDALKDRYDGIPDPRLDRIGRYV